MSAQKMREMVRQIQGLPALQAQAVLAFVSRKSARVVAKTLKSAIANAENNNGVKAGNFESEGSSGANGATASNASRPKRAGRPVRLSSAVAT